MIEACAGESIILRNEVNFFENNITENLRKKYIPFSESSYEFPPHNIISSKFPEQKNILKPSFVSFNKIEKFKIGEDCFSPVKPIEIVNAQVAVQIFDNELWDFRKDGQRMGLNSNLEFLWVGIDIGNIDKTNIELIKNKEISFHFQIFNEETIKTNPGWLKNISIFFQERIIPFRNGYSFTPDNEIPCDFSIDLVENSIIEFYNKDFISIQLFDLINLNCEIPIELNELKPFLEKKKLSNLLWLKLVFPEDITQKKIRCRLNCFPVINREIKKEIIKSPSLISSLSIPFGKKFYGLKSIKSPQDISFKYSILKTGLNKNDEISGRNSLRYILDLLERDFQAFNGIDNSSVSKAITLLEDSVLNLKKELNFDKQREAESLNKIYLQLRAENILKSIECEYWICPENIFNYTLNSKLLLNSFPDFHFHLIEKTKENHLNLELNKLDYKNKFTTLSNNRLVTKKEIELYIKSELGNLVKVIFINNDAEIGKDLEMGVTRILRVKVVLKETEKKLEVDKISHQLEQAVNMLWHGIYPIRVKVIYQLGSN